MFIASSQGIEGSRSKIDMCCAVVVIREHWVDNLPIVLLGIRSSFKPDANACAAELAYGSTFRLPGEVLEQTTSPAPGEVNDLLHRLRLFVRNRGYQIPHFRSTRHFNPRFILFSRTDSSQINCSRITHTCAICQNEHCYEVDDPQRQARSFSQAFCFLPSLPIVPNLLPSLLRCAVVY